MAEFLTVEDPDLARQRGADVLRSGLLVVAPTDTVYGVFADAFSMEATGRLLAARGADRGRPLPVVVRSPRQLTGIVRDVSEQAERLMAAFWPGALTIVFEAGGQLAWDLGDTRGTVAVRMPAEELVHDLVAEVGPLACTAACRVGGVAPRTAAQAAEQLDDVAALYLDGGPRPGGVSTIVDCSRGGAEVLRVGIVSADEVFAAATGAHGWGRPTEATPPESEAGAEPEPGGTADGEAAPDGASTDHESEDERAPDAEAGRHDEQEGTG